MESRETPTIRIELFGGPCFRLADGSIHSLQEKQGAILALLALSPGNRISRDELLDHIWPDEAPEAARARLRTALSSLRTSVPTAKGLIPRFTSVITLNRAVGVWIDSEEF